jgi:hypothetical protein
VAQAAQRHAAEVIRQWGGVSSLQMLQRQLSDDGDEEDPEEPLN